MSFNESVVLGRTGLKVGRLGVASGYWQPAAAIEAAFERGCNYMEWGTFIKGYSPHMRTALRNIAAKGQRDRLVLAVFTYAHQSFLTERFLVKGLKAARMEYADVLLLGYFPKTPSQRILHGAMKLKEKGLVRYLGISSHDRRAFPGFLKEGIFDVFHLRYNAVHRGAETEIFPFLPKEDRPGIVNFTSTAWGRLLNSKKMPPNESAPTAAEAYRFVLTNPAVDVCMIGPKTMGQTREDLGVLEQSPMSEDELARMRRIGDHVYGRRKQ